MRKQVRTWEQLWGFSGVAGRRQNFSQIRAFKEVEMGDQRLDMDSCDWSRKKSGGSHTGGQRWGFASFHDQDASFGQATVKTECTPERLV